MDEELTYQKLIIHLERFLTYKERLWSSSAKRNNKYYFNLLKEFLDGKPFNRDNVELFFNQLGINQATSTRRGCETSILAFAGWCFDEGLISKNWRTRIARTKVIKTPHILPDQKEVLEAIREELKYTEGDNIHSKFSKDEHKAFLSFILVACGGRNWETTNILREDVSVSGRQILISHGKTGPRIVAIPEVPWLIEDLDRRAKGLRTEAEIKTMSDSTHYKKDYSNRLFVSNPIRARAIMRRVGKRCGIERMQVHDLRRIFAREMKKNGADINDIRIAMGHKNIETTLGYLYDDPSDIQRIVNEYSPEARKYRTKEEKSKNCLDDVTKYGGLVEQNFDGEFLTMKVRII